jgi:hypothetical protein
VATPPPPPPPPPPVGEDGLPLSDVPPPEDDTTTADTSTSTSSGSTEDTATSTAESGSGAASTSDGGAIATSTGGFSTLTATKKSRSKSYIDRRSGIVVKIVTKPPVVEIQAKIKEITMKGVCTVLFSESLTIPANYSRFNDRFLKIWVTSPEEILQGQNKSIEAW